jgi:hypothetical protein
VRWTRLSCRCQPRRGKAGATPASAANPVELSAQVNHERGVVWRSALGMCIRDRWDRLRSEASARHAAETLATHRFRRANPLRPPPLPCVDDSAQRRWRWISVDICGPGRAGEGPGDLHDELVPTGDRQHQGCSAPVLCRCRRALGCLSVSPTLTLTPLVMCIITIVYCCTIYI